MGRDNVGPLSPDQRRRLVRFAVQSLLVTSLAMAVSGIGLVEWTQGYVVDDYAQFMGGNIRDVVSGTLPRGVTPSSLTEDQLATLDDNIRDRQEQGGLLAMRLTDASGRVVYSTIRGEVGATVEMDDRWTAAHEAESNAAILEAPDERFALPVEKYPIVRVSAPWARGQRAQPSGVIEVIKPYTSLEPRLLSPIPVVWGAVVAAALFVWVGVVGLTWRAERHIAGAQRKIDTLQGRIVTALRDSEADSIGTVNALNAAVDAKDSYTAGHCLKVAHNAHQAGKRLGLDEVELEMLERASLLHDIGKIGIPEDILLKPSGLTSEEYEIVKQHSEVGARIIASIPSLAELAPLVRAHHERWDGAGYPDGTDGHDTPIAARILATADALDAMMSSRPYRGGISADHAREELERNSGTQFDPQVVDVFVELLSEGAV